MNRRSFSQKAAASLAAVPLLGQASRVAVVPPAGFEPPEYIGEVPWCSVLSKEHSPAAGALLWISDGERTGYGRWNNGWEDLNGSPVEVTHWMYADEDPEEAPPLPQRE